MGICSQSTFQSINIILVLSNPVGEIEFLIIAVGKLCIVCNPMYASKLQANGI